MIQRSVVSLLMLFIIYGTQACSTGVTIPPAPREEIRKIVVLPVAAPVYLAGLVRDADTADQPPEGLRVLGELLTERFAGNPGFSVRAPESALEAAPLKSNDQLALNAREIGRQDGGDAVLLLEIEEYRRRTGTEYGTSSPASVAFAYRLISVHTGNILCGGRYEETQQSLFDNLFGLTKAFHRGFKWVSARRLLADGLGEKLDACPYTDGH